VRAFRNGMRRNNTERCTTAKIGRTAISYVNPPSSLLSDEHITGRILRCGHGPAALMPQCETRRRDGLGAGNVAALTEKTREYFRFCTQSMQVKFPSPRLRSAICAILLHGSLVLGRTTRLSLQNAGDEELGMCWRSTIFSGRMRSRLHCEARGPSRYICIHLQADGCWR